jgi:CO dehydrogenase maturation factor
MAKSIAVAGKGGTGKTTISALLISALVQMKKGPVLAVDADPDSNLGSLLGVQAKQSIGDLREEVLKEMKNLPAGMTKANYVEAGLHQLIEEADGFDLITMGKGEGAGCYCSLNNIIRKFSGDLTPSYPWVIIDNEAGLEHISRRTTSNIDALLIVVTENPLSLQSARSIEDITQYLDSRIRKQYLVTNMVRDDRLDAIRSRLDGLKTEYLCNIPFDEKLEEHIFNGESVFALTDSPVMDIMKNILEKVGGKNGTT